MLKKFSQIIVAISLTTFINSCGFQVIYRESDLKESYEKELASIRIQKDGGRLTQELRNALKDNFNPDYFDVEPKYVLIVDVTKTINRTYITSTGASGRNRVTLLVNYKLKDATSGKILSIGSSSVVDNYDVQENRYGTYVAEEYSSSNLTKTVALNIRNLLVNDLIELKKNHNTDEPLVNGVYTTQKEKDKLLKKAIESSCDGNIELNPSAENQVKKDFLSEGKPY